MKLSFSWAAGAMGVMLFAASLVAQAPQGQPQGQPQREGGPPPAAGQGQAPPQGQGAGPAAGRQGGGGGRGFTNLMVLPRDIAQPQLIAIMQNFNSALGVTCEHCHVFFGNGNAMNNMAADDKQPKKVARAMLLMVRDFNAKLATEVSKPAAQLTTAQCGTCHRGKSIPDYVAPPPPAPAGGPGAAPPAGGAAPGGGGRQGGGRGN